MRYLFLLIALLFFSVLSHAQVIKGKITDAASGKPIENANVYLNGTYAGTTSDAEGNFTITTEKTNIPLIISYVGYATQTISNYSDKLLNIALKRKINQLREVTIGDLEGMSREKAMRIFLREFIGSTSSDCVISNPDDIYFKYDKKRDVLTAGSDKPLLISNKKLGYKITYFLSGFTYAPLLTDYKGNYFFAEDTAGIEPGQIKKIIKARDEAYFGSRMHFIRSLWANELMKNDFLIYKTFPGTRDFGKQYLLTTANILTAKHIIEVENGQKFIMLGKDTTMNNHKFASNEIYIMYKKSNPAFLLQDDGNTGTIIDSNGYYGNGISWKESLGKSRVNKLLPYEFQPSK